MKSRLPTHEIAPYADAPTPTPVTLTIAGSDPSGGAGIQADLKTFAALRCFGTSALTALTVQNTLGVQSIHQLDASLVRDQIHAVAADLPVAATKVGMLGSERIVETVADAVQRHELYPFVLDPVMRAKTGRALLDPNAEEAIVDRLLPLTTLVTPNRHEAARLMQLDEPITTVTAAAMAAEHICDHLGARACIVKAVKRHRHGRDECVDVLYDRHDIHEIISPWYHGANTHGSGCTFSAVLTAALALDVPLLQAVDLAKQFIHAAIHRDLKLGLGTGPVNHLAWLET